MTLSKHPTLQEWAQWWMETYVKPTAKPSGYEHYHDNLRDGKALNHESIV